MLRDYLIKNNITISSLPNDLKEMYIKYLKIKRDTNLKMSGAVRKLFTHILDETEKVLIERIKEWKKQNVIISNLINYELDFFIIQNSV